MADIGELDTGANQQGAQFSLIDVFAAMTFCAILAAMFAPFLRALDPAKRAGLIGPFLLQALILVGGGFFAYSRRQKLVAEAGRRFGVVYSGSARGKQWPMLRTCVILLLLAVVQIIFSIAVSYVGNWFIYIQTMHCLLYTSPSPRDATLSRMPSSA